MSYEAMMILIPVFQTDC